MEIILASGNRHKADEFARIFTHHTILLPGDILSQKKPEVHATIPDVASSTSGLDRQTIRNTGDFSYEEKGLTFLENAFGKALACHALVGRPVLADDSGLCVRALGGMPGVYSARYGETDGKKLTSEEKNALLLSHLKGETDRSASFVCCLVFMLAPDRFFIVQEMCDGEIGYVPHGSGGFGYDPVFMLSGRGISIAELPDEEKDAISHRGRASRRIMTIIESMDFPGNNIGQFRK